MPILRDKREIASTTIKAEPSREERLDRLHAYILHNYGTAARTGKSSDNFERGLSFMFAALRAPAGDAGVREALTLAVNMIMENEPGDSRAVSNEAVALAAVSVGDTSAPVMEVIRAALAPREAEPVGPAGDGGQRVSPGTEEAELFAAATKIDLAAALRHIRDWRCYIDDHHRQKYADLIEAQAKLIAWLVNRPRDVAQTEKVPAGWVVKEQFEDNLKRST